MVSLFGRSILLSCSIITALAGPHPLHLPLRRRTCASPDPNDDLRAQHNHLHDNEGLDNDLWNATTIEKHVTQHRPIGARGLTMSDLPDPYTIDRRRATAVQPLYTVDTYFHIVSDTNNSVPGAVGYVTNKMVAAQFAYITNAYKSTGVAFNLLGTTRTVNDTWARNGDDLAMKTALRQGTYSTLNVYYQTLLMSTGQNGIPVGSVLLGFCSLPSSLITPTTPPSLYVLDGCNILSGTMPGSYETNYNLGGTSAHEIGHWNGLLHVFQDNTCDARSFGDYVADTPQEGVETFGCPVGKDSCPNSGVAAGSYDGSPRTTNPYGPSGFSGPDPIHNFMDYSQDSCYEGFTAGQAARMVNMWVIYRMGL